MLLLWILLLALLPASASADAGSEAPECEEEGPLSEAAAELLLRGTVPTSEELVRAVRAAGSDLVGIKAYYVRSAQAAEPKRWLAEFKRAADATVVCGLAQSERGQLWLAGQRAGALEPFASGRAVVRGSVSSAFEDPQIVVEDAAGEFVRVAIDRDQLARGVPLSDALRRPLRVQLLARGPSGPRPLAERVLAGGRDASSASVLETETAAVEFVSPELPAAARLADLRRARGKLPLRENQLLAKVAAAHAKQVCDAGKIAHELDAGGDPEQRLRAAGIRARRVGETVARASDTAAAFAAFEDSPSHRLTLLEPDFTDAGVGESRDARGRRCVVVLLAAWPRYVGR